MTLVEKPWDEWGKAPPVLAGVKTDERLGCRIVADAVGSLLMPGDAPKPLIWIADFNRLAPVCSIPGEPCQGLMPEFCRLMQRARATRREASFARNSKSVAVMARSRVLMVIGARCRAASRVSGSNPPDAVLRFVTEAT